MFSTFDVISSEKWLLQELNIHLVITKALYIFLLTIKLLRCLRSSVVFGGLF